MIRLVLLALFPMVCAAPAAAQSMDPNMPGMQPPPSHPKAGPAGQPEGRPETGGSPGVTTPAQATPGQATPSPGPAASPGAPMGGMSTPSASRAAAEPPIPDTPPPPAATDHLADRDYGAASMAAARRMARTEMGGGAYSKIWLEMLEYQAGSQGGGYRWSGQGWFGGDINRVVVRSEGEGVRSGLETAEAQALYSRAVSRYVDVQTGVRQDFSPRARTYATLGAQALFPFWLETEAALFLSTKGQVLARAEGSYDLRLFQRVVLQPRVELNLAAQDSPATRTGSGLSTAEAGLRLRYEVRREFAPYVGVSWERRFGRTADYWREAGDAASSTTFVVGLSAFF